MLHSDLLLFYIDFTQKICKSGYNNENTWNGGKYIKYSFLSILVEEIKTKLIYI